MASTARGERRAAPRDDNDSERRAASKDDDGSRSAVSVATTARNNAMRDERSTTTGNNVALSAVNQTILNNVTETDIRKRYNDNKAKLLQLKTDGALRQEQYNRKYAMLQVAYWSELDKVRNNAVPTEINV